MDERRVMDMKKLYEKHFRVKENEKIREHVMMVRIFLAAAVVCVSLFSMGITAYAFFTYTVTSSTNIIKAATFSLDKSVIDIESSATISLGPDGTYTLTADENGNKTFQLKLKPASKMTASTGFAKIVISSDDGQSDILYTEQIDITDSEYVLHISIPAGNTAQVKVVDNWGTCAKQSVVVSGKTYQPSFVKITTEPIVEENPEEEEIAEEPVVDEPVEEEQVDPEVVDPEVTPDDSVEESVDDPTKEEAPEDVGEDTSEGEGDGNEEIPPEGTSEGVE